MKKALLLFGIAGSLILGTWFCANVGEAHTKEKLKWNSSWKYATFSLTHENTAYLWHSSQEDKKNITVCVNAGHGCPKGTSRYTYSHPNKTGKVTGGSNAKGAVKSVSCSGGTTCRGGVSEATANLRVAKKIKKLLLDNGYDVLMIRSNNHSGLDNIARTVLANQYADCHIAIHYDSTTSNKGFFYIGVPAISSYRNMEPVKSHWKQHEKLGKQLLKGVKKSGVKIYSGGTMKIDLTQTSYSTVPSVDVEVGDRGSDLSSTTQLKIAQGLLKGVKMFFS